MAVSQSQIVDLLYKEAFGVTKTDTATNKSPSNESIPSPALNRGDTVWTQSDQIPGTAAATAGIVQAYTGANAVECTADNTTVPIGSIYPTWLTNLTYWIPTEFGSTYNVQVWVDSPGVADPTATGTQIFADGSGGTGQFYYNYQSGVLNFIGETIPTALTSGKVLYIVGYRYIGLVGVTNLPSGTDIGNLSFTNANISSTQTNANINLTPNGTGVVTSSANVHAPNFIGNVVGNISGNITVTGSNTQVLFNDSGLIGANGNFTFDKANALLTVDGAISATANITGGNVITSGIINVTGNANVGNLGTGGLITATGNIGGGNINTAGQVIATSNIVTSGNLVADYISAKTGNLDITAISTNSSINLTATGVGTINVNNAIISNVGGPNNAHDAATKEYVDNAVSAGLTIHSPVRVETPSALNATYAQGGTTPTITAISGGNVLTTSSTHNLSIDDMIVFDNSFNGLTAGTAYFVYSVPSSTQITVSATYPGPEVTGLTNGTGLTETSRANSGVGATLTNAGTQEALVIDTVSLSVGNRVLVYRQTNQAENGIYTVTTVGDGSTNWVLTRATDADTYAPNSAEGMSYGDYFFVQAGATGGGESYVCNTTGVIIIGTTNVTFAQFADTQIYTAGTGLTLTGTTFSVNASQTQVTAVGNLTSLSVVGTATVGNVSTAGEVTATGNIIGGNLSTAGTANIATLEVTGTSNLNAIANITITGGSNGQVIQTNGAGGLSFVTIDTWRIQNGTSNVAVATLDGNVTVAVAGVANVATFTSTGVNVTGTLSTSGNADFANITTGGLITATGNVTGGNITTGGVVSATGNIDGGNLNTAGLLSVTGNANIGNIGTAGLILALGNATAGNLVTGGVVTATGNVTGANIVAANGVYGNIANITGNAAVGGILTDNYYYANGSPVDFQQAAGSNNEIQFNSNDDFSASANLTFDPVTNILSVVGNVSTGNLIASGLASITGNANIGNIGTAGLITATGNIGGGNLVTSGVVTATGNITGSNVIANSTVFATTANISGNVNAGNITTTGLANVGSLTVTGVSNLGPVSNVTITGGSANYLLQTDGSGALTWVAPPSTNSIVNGTSNVSIPTTNGNVNTSVGGNANVFVVTGTGANVTGTLSSSGNLNAANIITAGIVSATGNGTFGNISTTGSGGNITGANVVSANTFTATANITGGNLITGGLITATGNITGGNITTAGVLSVTGNANIGNIGTAGVITATGNISGGNINTANAVLANTITANISANIGNTKVGWGTTTTSNIDANQTIAEFSTTGIAAIEFLVKGEDSTGAKYSVATVTAVTDGTNVDYVTYATAFLTSGTGALAVNISGGNVALQVTPSSSNSTVWTTQYRVM